MELPLVFFELLELRQSLLVGLPDLLDKDT